VILGNSKTTFVILDLVTAILDPKIFKEWSLTNSLRLFGKNQKCLSTINPQVYVWKWEYCEQLPSPLCEMRIVSHKFGDNTSYRFTTPLITIE